MTPDPRTVPAALDRLARQLPDHDALITDERSFTSAALRHEVHRAAAALIAMGVRAGDRVAIWSPNTWHWVVACLAIHHARGEIGAGETITIESIIGSTFTGRVAQTTTFGPYAAIIPEVGGTAHITGRHEFLIDPTDELKDGFLFR